MFGMTKSLNHHFSIKNTLAMRAFGAQIAREITSPFFKGSTVKRGGISKSSVAKRPPSFRKGGNAKVIALVGDLGAGKTTFTQGFLKELGVKRRVISPTFLLIRRYELKGKSQIPNPKIQTDAFHLDCYRIHKPQEMLSLGLREILKNPKHIVLIEWPELVKKYLPKDTMWIEISHPEKGTHREVYSSF